MDCIFCKIINGEIATELIFEDEYVVSFLDIHPSSPGHCLIVPKKHLIDFLAADQKELGACLVVLQRIASVLKISLNATGFNLVQNNGADAGQVIKHLHWHLIPRYPNDLLRLYPPEQDLTNTLDECRQKIKKALIAFN